MLKPHSVVSVAQLLPDLDKEDAANSSTNSKLLLCHMHCQGQENKL